jgi:hypothetical protein
MHIVVDILIAFLIPAMFGTVVGLGLWLAFVPA